MVNALIKDFLSKSRNRRLKIHCIGDALVDEYYTVRVNRISPEFPMPIMTSPHGRPTRRPGGAANVIYQLNKFNVDTGLISFTDPLLDEVLKQHKIKHIGGATLQGADHVPIKRRFLDNGIQVTRWDVEEYMYEDLDAQSILRLYDADKPDLVVLSDYGKGTFKSTHFLPVSLRELGIPTIVDPKREPLCQWIGCTVLKLNSLEAWELSGKVTCAPSEQCRILQQELSCKAVVITMGGHGVGVFTDNTYEEFVFGNHVKVSSVVGAGDCFAAIFSLAFALGFTPGESASIAWHAGANYVQGETNRPICPSDLLQDKFADLEDLASRDFPLVFTNGCFDILHSGHIQTLKFAKERANDVGGKVVVALNSDASVKRLKGESRPINHLEERSKVMAALEYVDFVASFDEDTPYEAVKKCDPNYIVKGGDYSPETIVGADIVGSTNVIIAPTVDGVSTTKIVTSLRGS